MARFNALPAALAAALALSGCAHSVTVSRSGELDWSEPDYEKEFDFYLNGLGDTGRVDLKEACPNSAPSQIQTKFTPGQYLIGFFTLWIYTPRSAFVWCEPASASGAGGAK